MEESQTGGNIASWSAHLIPAGSPVRYVLDTDDNDASIRLVIGGLEQVELEMELPEVSSIVGALQVAKRDIGERRGVAGEGGSTT